MLVVVASLTFHHRVVVYTASATARVMTTQLFMRWVKISVRLFSLIDHRAALLCRPRSTDRNVGAGGGSELWEYYIGQRCQEKMELKYSRRLSDTERQACLDVFHEKKLKLRSRDAVLSITLTHHMGDYTRTRPSMPWEIELTKADIIDCFKRGFKSCLTKAREKLAQLAVTMKQGNFVPTIVMSGGSADSGLLRDELCSMCERLGLPEPIFTANIDMPDR